MTFLERGWFGLVLLKLRLQTLFSLLEAVPTGALVIRMACSNIADYHDAADVFMYHARRNQFERFRGFLELISRFEFDFLRRENYFLNDSNFWCVQSSITHSGRTCACAVACLQPHNSIPNVGGVRDDS